MKNKILFAIMIFSLLTSVKIYSQGPIFWELAGNLNATATSILGPTTPGVPLNIFTGGTAAANQRVFISAGAGVGSGFLGIGNGFTTPRSRLHLHQGTNAGTNAGIFTNGQTLPLAVPRL